MGGHHDGADHHQHPRPAERVIEGVEGAVEQQRRQAQRGGSEVVAGLGRDRGRHAGEFEQPAGAQQQRHARHREQQREPEALLQRGRDRLLAARADVVGDGRRHRLQRAGEQHHHRDVVAAADGDAGEVLGAVAAGDHGVGDHHRHRQQLRDQHRPGVVQQLADDGTAGGRREGGCGIAHARGAGTEGVDDRRLPIADKEGRREQIIPAGRTMPDELQRTIAAPATSIRSSRRATPAIAGAAASPTRAPASPHPTAA